MENGILTVRLEAAVADVPPLGPSDREFERGVRFVERGPVRLKFNPDSSKYRSFKDMLS